MPAKLLQSYPTLCDPVAHSPLGSSVLGFSRQEYWSRLPFPSPGDLPDPGIELACLMSAALAGIFFSTKPWQQIIANNSMGYHSPSFARKTRLNLLKARIKTFFPASVSSRVWL